MLPVRTPKILPLNASEKFGHCYLVACKTTILYFDEEFYNKCLKCLSTECGCVEVQNGCLQENSSACPPTVVDRSIPSVSMWSAELKKDLLSDMFSTEEVLSQGDIKNLEVEKFSGQLDHQHFLDQDFMNLKFLDTFTGISDLSSMDTDINVDLKELLGDVLASEYADSSFLNTDTVIPSLIPVSELSYDLNTTLQGDPISLEAAIPARELSYDLKTSNDVQLVNNSLEISACGEVSSTTNTLYDLLDERASSSCSFVDEVDMSGGSEVVEESAAGRKYLEMRRKNNIASQRSRKIRKQKNSKMSDRLKELEKENKELSLLAEGLEKERNTLQELLMSIIAKKS